MTVEELSHPAASDATNAPTINLVMFRAIALLTAVATFATAQTPAKSVPWNQTAEALSGKHVIVRLAEGTVIEGAWLSVTLDSFRFRVEKSSAKDQFPKGAHQIPRSTVSSIRFREKRVRGRVIGTIAGFYGVLAIAAAATRSRDAAQGAWGLAAIAGAAGGYQLGKSVDKATRELLIEP